MILSATSSILNPAHLSLGSLMMAINGCIQREGEVTHLVAQQLFDLSGDLTGLLIGICSFASRRDTTTNLRMAAGKIRAMGKAVFQPRDIFMPELRVDTLKVKSRIFQ